MRASWAFYRTLIHHHHKRIDVTIHGLQWLFHAQVAQDLASQKHKTKHSKQTTIAPPSVGLKHWHAHHWVPGVRTQMQGLRHPELERDSYIVRNNNFWEVIRNLEAETSYMHVICVHTIFRLSKKYFDLKGSTLYLCNPPSSWKTSFFKRQKLAKRARFEGLQKNPENMPGVVFKE